jgi:predicted esterase YcpF (UPF0227 family)
VIIYLHGFNSSPQSGKAQHLKQYLDGQGKGAEFACPQLPHRPDRAVAVVEAEIVRHPKEKITLVGSSLGGFYATWLAEKHGVRAVLINPAIDPHVGLRAYLGPQQAFQGGERYELTQEHLRKWKEFFLTRVHPERYLLLVETGDEVLDYRAAVRKYKGAKQVVVQGGDHSLASFPEQIPLILEFAGINLTTSAPSRPRFRL